MRRIDRLICAVLLWLMSVGAMCQMYDPVKWSVKLSKVQNGKATITYEAVIEKGWHIYSTKEQKDGPVPTSFTFTDMKGVKVLSDINPRSNLVEQYEPSFGMTLGWYEEKAVFQQQVKIESGGDFTLKGYITYMCCNDQTCTPPANMEFDLSQKRGDVAKNEEVEAFSGKDKIFAPVENKAEEGVKSGDTVAMQTVSRENTYERADTWANVEKEMKAYGESTIATDGGSLLAIFLLGLLGGFVAVITPCVWPIIPMTVSFFLKRSKDAKEGKRAAIVYGLSIVGIYVLLGVLMTVFLGANALNSLSTNAIFNVFLFVLLVVFAISFFGGFELALPSSWSTKLDQKVDETAGWLSVLFMAFTLVIVSFSCTGPIIGTLLVDVSSKGSILAPTVGMFGFAVALAIPFTLFAFFPTMLKKLPRSGGWLNSVKVLLGFFELAFALKFLSMADLAYGWRILDREVFLVLWIVIFAMAGFYLLGKIRFPGDDEVETVSIPRFFLSIATFAFAIYLIPGLWGAPLKSASAFIPPITTQDFNLHKGKVNVKFKDYDDALKFAQDNKKPVVVDFTGHACVNCRKMESAVWTDPRVRAMLKDEYVLVSLYVDDRMSLDKPMEVMDGSVKRTLYTEGDKWSFLQKSKFGANAQPFYVILDADGNPLNTSFGFTENADDFLSYLRTGMKNFRRNK